MMVERKMMSVDEMSVMLGISRPRAYELTKSDGFPAMRVGRRILVDRAGLDQWLEQQKTRGAR